MKTTLSLIAILIISGLSLGFSEPGIITGTVKDNKGIPLSGVSVSTDNPKKTVLTDMNGYYSIRVNANTGRVIFSLQGYITISKKIKNRNVIDVIMHKEVKSPAEIAEQEQTLSDRSGIIRPGVPAVHKKAEAAYMIAGRASNNLPGRYNYNYNTEGYSTIHENGFRSVMNNPLSTFSIDVDRASYSNIRRFINHGQKPPVDAVRIEEMINYFNYDYHEPVNEHPFAVYTEVSECPWQEGHYLMHVGLKGKSIEKDKLPPSNLVFLLDVSGSMNSPNKLPLLKSAFRMLVNELRESDRVSIVVYAGAAGVVLEPTPGDKKKDILQAVDRLSAGGSTAGGQGLKLAYKLAFENFIEEGNNRIILATDGDFNVGVSSNAEMERLIEKKRDEGVYITALGFGMGNYKDDKMEIIADKGNGNYSYIDNIQEARKTLVNEFGSTMFTIAKDVKFQIEFNPARIKSYRLIGYENRLLNDEDFNDDTKDAGEIGAGHSVTALYELIPADSNKEPVSIDPLKYQEEREKVDGPLSRELLTIKLRYKKPGSNSSDLMEIAVRQKVKKFAGSSQDLRFSAAVVEFGMLLRSSGHKGTSCFDSVISIARNSKGNDAEGYRGEFIRLVKTAKELGLEYDTGQVKD
ncbi:MAG: von Willebrand factor type A domain-containing protein [Bacteroidales bacterium]|nr:von Willebrand factor type A domain-containing protein [Bacteroidales bacterium]